MVFSYLSPLSLLINRILDGVELRTGSHLVSSEELFKTRLGNNFVTNVNLSLLFADPSDEGIPTDLCEIRERVL